MEPNNQTLNQPASPKTVALGSLKTRSLLPAPRGSSPSLFGLRWTVCCWLRRRGRLIRFWGRLRAGLFRRPLGRCFLMDYLPHLVEPLIDLGLGPFHALLR